MFQRQAGSQRPSERDRFVRILQDAHAGELAAAYAYQAHAKSLRRRPERREVEAIEAAEWHHRGLVGEMLTALEATPRRRRELLMAFIGRFFGSLCFVTGWFGPMYAAGRLEAMNVQQYLDARNLAQVLGYIAYVEQLDAMVAEEDRHEQFFARHAAGHLLLPIVRFFLKWDPSLTLRKATSDYPAATDHAI
ncbi:MAG: hypothetical protein ACOYN3_03410 [Acidimicrobiia bacterium]